MGQKGDEEMGRGMDMTNTEVKNLLENYKIHRKLTRDLLLSLGQEHLSVKPFHASGSFGKQFRHLIDIERSYVESLTTGSLSFFRPNVDHSIEIDKIRLINEMDTLDRELIQIICSLGNVKAYNKYIDCRQAVNYLGESNMFASPIRILSWITEHEIFHEGELALYVRNEKLKFPDSWMIWGLR